MAHLAAALRDSRQKGMLMSNLMLTDQERDAFCQEITRKRALEYFYVFDNVPLHFIYKDNVIPGELTEMEERNKALTEKLWSEGYNRYIVGGVSNLFICPTMTQVSIAYQEAFLIHRVDARGLVPAEVASPAAYRTLEEVEADFDAWMTSTGWPFVEEARRSAPSGFWRRFLTTPDRTPRVVSALPAGNEVLAELIVTWSEDGVLKETACAMVLNYHVDGTLLMYRAYADPANWPGVSSVKETAPGPSPDQSKGVMDRFYDYQRALQIDVATSALEKRNLSIIEGAWVDAQNDDLDTKVFHPERFRMQLPMQKCSYNLGISEDVAAIVEKAAPDQKMRLGMTYAKGNQVVAEGVISWNRDGSATETAFISFLVIDEDGLIIRERRYHGMDNWPGEDRVRARLGL
jgi:hypothetical protein